MEVGGEGFFFDHRQSNCNMKKVKEDWVEEVLASADKIQRMEAGENLFAGVRLRLHTKVRQLEPVHTRTVWLAAAGIALLFTMNILLLTKTENVQRVKTNSSELTQNNFDIYSN